MTQRWTIEGYCGGDATGFVRNVDCGESRIRLLLKRLAARHLSDEEIVDATLGSGAELDIRRDPRAAQLVLMTSGSEYYYVARAESGIARSEVQTL